MGGPQIMCFAVSEILFATVLCLYQRLPTQKNFATRFFDHKLHFCDIYIKAVSLNGPLNEFNSTKQNHSS